MNELLPNNVRVKSNEEFSDLAESIEQGTGLLVDCSERIYHADTTYWSKSKIWTYFKSPQTFRSVYLDRSMSHPAASVRMDAGSIFHAVLLEGRPFRSVVSVYPQSCLKSNGAINHKPAKEFADQARSEGKYVMKEKETVPIQKAIQKVRSKDHIGEWIELAQESDQVEKTFVWRCEHSGLLCKSRTDFYLLGGGLSPIVFDLKFTGMWSRQNFKNSSRKFGYWFQDAHYSTGFEAVLGIIPDFKFICVNESAPYQSAVNFHNEPTRYRTFPAYAATMSDLSEKLKQYEADPTNEATFLDPDELQLNPIVLNDYDLVRGAY